MPEKLPPPQENLKEKKLEEQPIEDTQSPEYFAAHAEEIRKENEEFEKRQNEENKISPEDYDFLTDAGFDLEKRREARTDAGVMIEIPRNEGQSAFVKPENFRKWINNLKDLLNETSATESLSMVKIDFFKNRIFVFTPKGDVEDLPEGATPIDFAYAIHTDLGHAVKGAKVNGKIAPIDSELKNGDVVEIIRGKVSKPSLDWLRIVRTAEAKHHIKVWFHNKK
jgi:molybdopterin converting factor small subunit